MRRGAAVLACALACATWPAAAAGAGATAREVRELAAAAQRDPAALQRLRAVDAVDGRPVDLAGALRGSGADVRARLRALAQAGDRGEPGLTRPAARDEARDVLAERRFRETSVPTPLRTVRERIGEALSALGGPLEAAVAWLAGLVPGGPAVAWAVLATGLLGLAALFAGRAGPRRPAAAVDGLAPGARPHEEGKSAAHLRREADRAERAGELEEALRLRFRAGLVELDSRALIELRPALTNSELLRAVDSPTLGELVRDFEDVAYGGRQAGEEDLRAARDGWPRVVDEAASR